MIFKFILWVKRLLNHECPHAEYCGGYEKNSLCCNEGYLEGYCGIDKELRRRRKKW